MTTQTDLKDITKSYIPLLAVIGLVFFTFQGGVAYQSITQAPTTLSKKVDDLETARKQDLVDINAAIARLASGVEDLRKTILDPASRGVPVDIVRFSDLRVFCLELRVENPATNIKCPPGGGQ